MIPYVRKRGMDLQFFAQERSEPATPRRRSKAREEGQVAKSQDLTAAAVILTGLLGVFLLAGFIVNLLTQYLRETFALIGAPSLSDPNWWKRPFLSGAVTYVLAWLPVGGFCAVVAIALLIWQVGFAISPKALEIKFSRLNPVQGMGRIFALRSLVELLKGVLKALVLLLVLYLALRKDLALLMGTLRADFIQGVTVAADRVFWLSLRMAVILLALGLFDYAYQKYEFEKSIRMSKQEIKEEYKQMEGDPLVKRRIRQRQRELARRRMMAEVPKADVVVTNPTAIAVAIRYETSAMEAPVVVAKGEGFIAQRIREIAREHQVPIVENRPLARALFQQVELGEEIPEALYRAVAEVLAFVYRLKGNQGSPPRNER